MEIKEFQSVLPEKKQQIAEKVQSINAIAKASVRTSSRVARFTKEGLTASQMKEGAEKQPTNNQYGDAHIGTFINQASRNKKGKRQEKLSSPEENVFSYHSQRNSFSKDYSVDTFCVQKSSPWEERISMYKKNPDTHVLSDDKYGEDFLAMVKKSQVTFGSGTNAETHAGMNAGMNAGINAGINAGVDAGVNAGVEAGVNAGVSAAVNGGVYAGGIASGTATGGVGTAITVGVDLVKKAAEKGWEAVKEAAENTKEDSKKFISNFLRAMIIFPIMLIVVLAFVTTGAGGIIAYSNRDLDELPIVEIARQELDQAEENIGGIKYKAWYGVNGNWCAMFVSFCSYKCELTESGVMPKSTSVSNMMNWYKEKGQFVNKIDEDGNWYIPKAGDIIIFKSNGASHVGIVIDYEKESGKVKTIEGNAGPSNTEPYHEGSRVTECSYALSYSRITGYGIPNYPEDTNPESSETEIAIRDILDFDVPKSGTSFVFT